MNRQAVSPLKRWIDSLLDNCNFDASTYATATYKTADATDVSHSESKDNSTNASASASRNDATSSDSHCSQDLAERTERETYRIQKNRNDLIDCEPGSKTTELECKRHATKATKRQHAGEQEAQQSKMSRCDPDDAQTSRMEASDSDEFDYLDDSVETAAVSPVTLSIYIATDSPVTLTFVKLLLNNDVPCRLYWSPMVPPRTGLAKPSRKCPVYTTGDVSHLLHTEWLVVISGADANKCAADLAGERRRLIASLNPSASESRKLIFLRVGACSLWRQLRESLADFVKAGWKVTDVGFTYTWQPTCSTSAAGVSSQLRHLSWRSVVSGRQSAFESFRRRLGKDLFGSEKIRFESHADAGQCLERYLLKVMHSDVLSRPVRLKKLTRRLEQLSSTHKHRVIDTLVSSVLPNVVMMLVEVAEPHPPYKIMLKYPQLYPITEFVTKLLVFEMDDNGEVLRSRSIVIPNVSGEYRAQRLLVDYLWNCDYFDLRMNERKLLAQHRVVFASFNFVEADFNDLYAIRVSSLLLSESIHRANEPVHLLPSSGEGDVQQLQSGEYEEVNCKNRKQIKSVNLAASASEAGYQICVTDAQRRLDESVALVAANLGCYVGVLKTDKKDDGSVWIVCGVYHRIYEFMLHGKTYESVQNFKVNHLYPPEKTKPQKNAAQKRSTLKKIPTFFNCPTRIRALEYETRNRMLLVSTIDVATKKRELLIFQLDANVRFDLVRTVALDFAAFDQLPDAIGANYALFSQPDLLAVDSSRSRLYMLHTVHSSSSRDNNQVQTAADGNAIELRLERFLITGDCKITHEACVNQCKFLPSSANVTTSRSSNLRISLPFVKRARKQHVICLSDGQLWSYDYKL